jgi:squalene-hopene/tetraprenyl-beta-curcumene cyclase
MSAAADDFAEIEQQDLDTRIEIHETGLDAGIARATEGLLAQQDSKGYWCYELEADCTIPAEYILMMHFMDEIDVELQEKIAVYLRAQQQDDGGWPLYHDGKFDLSCTVKAYYALKFAGDSPNAPHMTAARELILANGGAARSNVFTRITLAMFEQVPWRATPVVPVELMLLPRWSPFHLSKVSYWTRTVVVPLTILCSLKAKARNPLSVGVAELFTEPPRDEKDYFPVTSRLNRLFIRLDSLARRLEPLIPRWIRNKAIKRAEAWFVERLNGDGGLGAIFPAMVNAYEALDLLGYPKDHPLRVTARQAIDDLLVVKEDYAYCQPCVSPVWDTALAALAVQEAATPAGEAAVGRALDWLKGVQLLDEPGDWRDDHPGLEGGGWAFQFRNDYYPDLDDTAVVGWAMHNTGDARYAESIRRAAVWLRGMQSRNGGFAAFDADNDKYYLNEIPFADHGALLDPPTADVSARCVTLFARLNQDGAYTEAMQRCIRYLRDEQEDDGSWFGRWGTNYVYGTWSVLVAFEEAGIPHSDPAVQRAVSWLKSKQRPDGGWGEDNDSYFYPATNGEAKLSTAFQTAWAMLALLAGGEDAESPALRRGAAYLLQTQREDGLWRDVGFTAPGFPRVFHLKYHGYDKFFPLWALARYRNRRRAAGE